MPEPRENLPKPTEEKEKIDNKYNIIFKFFNQFPMF